MGELFTRLLEAVAADPDRPVGALDLLSPEQFDELVHRHNDTALTVPEVTMPELFERQVAAARALVEADAGQDVRAQRQLLGLAHDLAGRVDQLDIGQHDELHGARRRLARREVSADPCSGVVLEVDAVADQLLELRIVRHGRAPYTMNAVTSGSRPEDVTTMYWVRHGEADNNSGTFPMQSERMFAAVQGNGGTARLVMLPAESHGYAARESVGHVLWEMTTWLDRWVKGVTP